jgi:hypothetical protein
LLKENKTWMKMLFKKILFCLGLSVLHLSWARDKEFEKGITIEQDPSFGYVGFGMSFVSGTFNLSQSTPVQSPAGTPLEPTPAVFKAIPDQENNGKGALMFSAVFGFMKNIDKTLFTTGIFGGFNWSSLSQKWTTDFVVPADTTVNRTASTTPVSSALHLPFSIEAGGQIGLWAHPRLLPFVRVGWALMRGGVNRTPYVNRYRYTYFNGIMVGGGINFMTTKQSCVTLSFDWYGYGKRTIRNFNTVRSPTFPAKDANDNNTTTSYNYTTMLTSAIKPSYTRLMLSIKYVLPNDDHYDML